jgi:hypothetical protein
VRPTRSLLPAARRGEHGSSALSLSSVSSAGSQSRTSPFATATCCSNAGRQPALSARLTPLRTRPNHHHPQLRLPFLGREHRRRGGRRSLKWTTSSTTPPRSRSKASATGCVNAPPRPPINRARGPTTGTLMTSRPRLAGSASSRPQLAQSSVPVDTANGSTEPNGAAQESNLPTTGLRPPAGFEVAGSEADLGVFAGL